MQLKQIIEFIIDYMDSSQSNPETKQQSRNYKCPCGKTYLSNAAIFTHIKQKHGGVPPGPIEKPKLESKPRGRPPLSTKNKNTNGDSKGSEKGKEQSKQDVGGNRSYYQAFAEIFIIMNELPLRQQFNHQVWETVDGYRRLEEYIQTSQRQTNFRYMGVCLGTGMSQFLKEVSIGFQKHTWKFEQVFLLFILLLQYTIDQNNRSSIIEEAPVELLIDYINPFINQHIGDFAQYLHIQDLWIFRKENMTRIFLCFYNWLKWKQYTQYIITLL